MRSERDVAADALYVHVTDVPVDHTEELPDGTLVDVDARGELVGVEILAVSSGWDVGALAERFTMEAFDLKALSAIAHLPIVHSATVPTRSVASESAATDASVGSVANMVSQPA